VRYQAALITENLTFVVRRCALTTRQILLSCF